jgi:integrase
MSREPNVPRYRLKKTCSSSGQLHKYGVVTLTDGAGGRRDVILGEYKSKESLKEYARVIAEWKANAVAPAATARNDITIAELLELYRPYCERRYPSPSLELQNTRFALQPLRVLYDTLPAKEFSAPALSALILSMATGDWLTEKQKEERKKSGQRIDLARRTVAQRVGRIRRFFKWAVSKGHVPATVLVELQTVEVEPGMGRESKIVRPVSAALVEDTLPYLQPVVADIIRLLSLTGARCSEITGMKAKLLDMVGPIWSLRPEHHKTQRHAHERIIALGPQAQAIVKKYLVPNLDTFLFSPKASKKTFWLNQRAARKSKVPPSQLCRKRRRPKRVPRDNYDSHSIGHAIRRGVERLNADRAKQDLQPVDLWHVHQLRHARATTVRRELGLEAAQAVLGHASIQTAQLYAEKNAELAARVAAKLG